MGGYARIARRKINGNNKTKESAKMDEQYYIVRCDRSGVFFGQIKERNGQEITMVNVRCLWSWYGAAQTLQLSTEGTNKPNKCRFTEFVKELTVLDAIQLVPCTPQATNSLSEVAEWKA